MARPCAILATHIGFTERFVLRRATDEVFDCCGLRQVTVDTHRSAERHEVVRKCVVIRTVKADTASHTDVVRRKVTEQDRLDSVPGAEMSGFSKIGNPSNWSG